jgi:hypothetical protein
MTTEGGGLELVTFVMSGVMAAAVINAAVMTGSRRDERRWVPVMTLHQR